MNTIIKKSQLAKELEISRARVSQLVEKGLPVRGDGKVNRVEALSWIAQFMSSQGGGWLVRGAGRQNIASRAQALLGKSEPKAQKSEFQRGAEWVAQNLCESARTVFPGTFAGMTLDEIEWLDESPEERRRSVRVLLAAVAIYLIQGWLEHYIDSAALSKIDWSAFGDEAETAAREAEEFFAYWSGPPDEDEPATE